MKKLIQISAIEHVASQLPIRCPSHRFLLELDDFAVDAMFERYRIRYRKYLKTWLRSRVGKCT